MRESIMVSPFRFGFFTNFGADEWNGTFSNGGSPWTGEFHVEIAKALERAAFDFIFFDDNLLVPETYGNSMDAYLRLSATAPKHDPAPLASLIGASTKDIGVVITLSTLAYPPYMLARLCATLDHICRGRFGWNIVTSTEHGAAQNFGLDQLPLRVDRYEVAEEYMDLVGQLFRSWEPDAVVLDREKGIYADASKVHAINFAGKHFKSRGPLNTVPSPQGRPAYFQAGASPVGRAFAAKHADAVIVSAKGPAGMKAFRDDVRAKVAAAGRDPDSVKVFFLLAPVLGATTSEARAKHDRLRSSPFILERTLAFTSSISNIDFAQFDLDKPLPTLTTEGGSGTLEKIIQQSGGQGSDKTLRELAKIGMGNSVDLVGTPDEVADEMVAIAEHVGGDGFLFTSPSQQVSRHYITELTEGLAPALQKRGLMRSASTPGTLRHKLQA